MQKAELKGLLLDALQAAGATVVDRTPADETDYCDFDITHLDLPDGRLRGRFFLWELTPDKSRTGRPAGEHKLQLTLGDRSAGSLNFPSARGRWNFLLGYSQGYELFVGFQAELHRDFGWSKLVACREEALDRAHETGWATHLRGSSRTSGEQELAIAFKPPRIIDWLRFQLTHPNSYGPARKAAADEWGAGTQIAEPTSTPPVVDAIPEAAVSPPTAEELEHEDEVLTSIGGEVDISTGMETATVQVNIAERIAATNRHNQLVLRINNRAHEVFGGAAVVIDRDIPGHRVTYPGASIQPDLGLRHGTTESPHYVIVEAKSLPDDTSGQWRQIIVGVGELARYAMVYEVRFDIWPVRVLALEKLPEDQDPQRFLRDLHDNEDICVVWPDGAGFRTFSSHHEDVSWLAEPLEG